MCLRVIDHVQVHVRTKESLKWRVLVHYSAAYCRCPHSILSQVSHEYAGRDMIPKAVCKLSSLNSLACVPLWVFKVRQSSWVLRSSKLEKDWGSCLSVNMKQQVVSLAELSRWPFFFANLWQELG